MSGHEKKLWPHVLPGVMFSPMSKTEPDDIHALGPLDGPSRGQAAYDSIQPLLATLADGDLLTINIDLTAAAIGAIGVVERAREPELLARFLSLPASEFDPSQIELLSTLGWAVLHVATRIGEARGNGRAKLPPRLVESAITLETRMQICCEYHLGDHPEASGQLARLRPGISYRDLAADLLGYAELYRTYQDLLSGDLKHYRATDEAEAVQTAEQIYTLLGEAATAEPQISSIDARRIWTLLVPTYENVAATGRWLLRRESTRAERLFPSLFRVSRSGRRSRSGEPEAGAEPGTEPGTPGEGTATTAQRPGAN
jgi:hypothetical protein